MIDLNSPHFKLTASELEIFQPLKKLRSDLRTQVCNVYYLASLLADSLDNIDEYRGIDVKIELHSGLSYITKFLNLGKSKIITSLGDLSLFEIKSINTQNDELIRRSHG